MRLLRTYRDLPDDARGAVAVLGNFDGVHRGHQAVIAAGRAEARRLGAPLAVVSFEPHPRQFFAPAAPPFRLTSLDSKARLLQRLGVGLLYALPFDRAFSQLLAQDFVLEVLVRGLGARHVVAGYDFVFGHRRGGTPGLLGEMAEMEGFGLTVVEPVTGADDEIVSSTRIRQHLEAGEPEGAAALLGHWWEVEGDVAQGDRRGRTIGFPTANVALGDLLRPRLGVYAVRAGIAGADATEWHDAVANLGRRPTFGKEDVLLEAHLLDYDGDLYGRRLRVAFHAFIREERKFAGLDPLKAQIAADAAAARALLARPELARQRYALSVTPA